MLDQTKKVVLILAAVAVVGILVLSAQAPQGDTKAPYPFSSVAQVVHYNRDNTCDCGSATLVAVRNGKALWLTAAHVAGPVGNEFTIKCRKDKGQVVKGVVIDKLNHSGFATDAALILSDAPEGMQPVTVAAYDPAYGPWTNAGYGYGENPKMGNGRLWVSTSQKTEQGDGIIYGSGLFVGGMSGGAMFDARGYHVGITNGSTNGFSIATSGPNVRAMIAKHLGD